MSLHKDAGSRGKHSALDPNVVIAPALKPPAYPRQMILADLAHAGSIRWYHRGGTESGGASNDVLKRLRSCGPEAKRGEGAAQQLP
jgi:hypothetical protein